MSFKIVEDVSRENPDLLRINLGRTCYTHTVLVIDKLRALGHDAYLMAKSPGEGGYTPPGFLPRTVIGLDGKPYPCSKVSHDAIWCDGQQFDTLGSANEYDRPIYRRNGVGTDADPNWSFDPADGPQIIASPAWNQVPQRDWRMNNPPLTEGAPALPPPVTIPEPSGYPGDDRFDAVGVTLFDDYAAAGRSPNPQMGRWFGRTIYDWLARNEPTLDASIAKHRREWRAILGLPPS